jgi:hypothetical protein
MRSTPPRKRRAAGTPARDGVRSADAIRVKAVVSISARVNQASSPEAKIALFRSLFRGREDVYPRRFESRKTGRTGYAPACANEWVRGICEKSRIKCAECPHRRFLPVTDDVVASSACVCLPRTTDDAKREVRIYDYADLNVPMLARMFDRRCRGYEAVGYTVLLPASAIPGWPADVVLPSDPVWKRDYSGSVRRLVTDGVDTPLASLFVHVARTVPPDADGADHDTRTAGQPGYNRRMADEDLKAELERLKAENEQLKNQRGRSVSLKVSEKGGVSVYGLGRFPVTLYKEQWTKLLSMTDEIRTFIKENEPKLKAKPE